MPAPQSPAAPTPAPLIPARPTPDFERLLRNFTEHATQTADDGRRQTWRFADGGRAYQLIYFPRRNGHVFRKFQTNPALREFLMLQTLQRNAIPAPRAIAHLVGLRIGELLGDALIIHGSPHAMARDAAYPSTHDASQATPLVALAWRARAAGEPLARRAKLASQLLKIVHQLGAARLRCRRFALHQFSVDPAGGVFISDASQLIRGAPHINDLFHLAASASPVATRTDLLRGWRRFAPEVYSPPRHNPVLWKKWKQIASDARRGRKVTQRFVAEEWSGLFTATREWPQPYAVASRLRLTDADWRAAWPTLLARLRSGQFTTLKADASGSVFSGEIVLQGRPIPIIVKQPRPKRWYRYVTEAVRGAKARRTWRKAWQLIARDIPCEYPLLLMERRRFGYVTEALIVFERVPGERLDQLDLDALPSPHREMLFRRAGNTTRAVERGGLAHYDAKSTNWIVYQPGLADDPRPILIDVDGVRPLNQWLVAWGVRRLLRALKQHPQYTAADSLNLCRGYAPFVAHHAADDAGSAT